MIITKLGQTFNVNPNLTSNHGWNFWGDVQSGSWEPQTFEIMQKFLSKEHSYVDVGAWIGPTALFGSRLARQCIALEPDPKAFEQLKANVDLNPDITNLTILNKAISASSGKIKMGSSNPGDSKSSILFSGSASWEVEALTLREVLTTHDALDCNFIKMDIEGGEAIVLPAIKDLLAELQPTLYLSIHDFWIPRLIDFLENVYEVASYYKYVYDSSLKPITRKRLSQFPMYSELLITNVEL